jgi:hypothetical protein
LQSARRAPHTHWHTHCLLQTCKPRPSSSSSRRSFKLMERAEKHKSSSTQIDARNALKGENFRF